MSNKNVSRNSPCPCGSGKKYKACCMNKDALQETSDVLWYKLRQTDEKIVSQLMQYAAQSYEGDVIEDAWFEFSCFDEGDPFDIDSDQNQAFMPWFLYNWGVVDQFYDDEESVYDDEQEDGQFADNYDPFAGDDELFPDDDEDFDEGEEYSLPSIAQNYLEEHGKRLSDMERRFIELNCDANFSFYEILVCDPGKGFKLRDVLTGSEVDVVEKSASQDAEIGEILFAKVIQYDQLGMLMGCAPILIPGRYKVNIIDLRSKIRTIEKEVTTACHNEWDYEIRGLYLLIYEIMHTTPLFVDSDGDPISWHEMRFKITSADLVFEKLKPLALPEEFPNDDLLEDAEFDENGNLIKVEFPWLKKGGSKQMPDQYANLGDLTIDGEQLYASANSEKQAKKLRKEIEKRLGKDVSHISTEVIAFDPFGHNALTNDEDSKVDFEKLDAQESHEKTSAEIAALMEQTLAEHWDNWIRQKIPALGGITPRQAIKDPDGRDKVLALLDDLERREKRKKDGSSQAPHIQRVRKQLGLDEPQPGLDM